MFANHEIVKDENKELPVQEVTEGIAIIVLAAIFQAFDTSMPYIINDPWFLVSLQCVLYVHFAFLCMWLIIS